MIGSKKLVLANVRLNFFFFLTNNKNILKQQNVRTCKTNKGVLCSTTWLIWISPFKVFYPDIFERSKQSQMHQKKNRLEMLSLVAV